MRYEKAENCTLNLYSTISRWVPLMYFLFHCTFYDDVRNFLFDKVIERNALIANFDCHHKVLFLCNIAYPHKSRLKAAFVFRAMEKLRSKHAPL